MKLHKLQFMIITTYMLLRILAQNKKGITHTHEVNKTKA